MAATSSFMVVLASNAMVSMLASMPHGPTAVTLS